MEQGFAGLKTFEQSIDVRKVVKSLAYIVIGKVDLAHKKSGWKGLGESGNGQALLGEALGARAILVVCSVNNYVNLTHF